MGVAPGRPLSLRYPGPGMTTAARHRGRDVREMAVITRGLVAYNLVYLGAAWLTIALAFVLFWLYPGWYTFVLAFVLISSRQQALLNCEHEAAHLKFLPGRRANDLVGTFLCAGPVGSPFGAARTRHLAHHRLLATDEDPDHDLHAAENMSTRGGLWRHFAGGLMGAYAGMVLMGPSAPRAAGEAGTARRDVMSLVVCQLVLAAGISLAFTWWVYPALWLAPLATVTTLSHLLRSFVEHAVTDSEVAQHDNRLITILSNPVERGLLAPYNMNFHAEHHLHPAVPAPRLPVMRRRLAERDDTPPLLVRSSYGSAVRRYARSLPR